MSEFSIRDVRDLTEKILRAANAAQSEADLQTEIEHVLRNLFAKMGINYEPHHNTTVLRGRPDTLYGSVVVEYKIPGTLKSEPKLRSAVEEAQRNIMELSEKYQESKTSYVGIVIDGYKITFTKFRHERWVTEAITDVNMESVKRMLEYLRGLSRKPLHPDFMVKDFGPGSDLAKSSVQTLYQQFRKEKVPRAKVLFEEWKKTFNQVCGYNFLSPKLDVQELIDAYELPSKKVDLTELLFCIHTYYALVIKFLAAEIAVTYASESFKSFLDELMLLNQTKLRTKLEELEEGGIFSESGIRNFLEGDFFAWYIDIWNSETKQVITSVAKKLSEYEPATATLEPDDVRDLLKKLYQYLVPRKIRHDLGEFFTPDWLAELTLNEVGYVGDANARVLDPACGSGTFLVLAIKRIKETADTSNLDQNVILEKILENVIGFDLNPLAVIAARTNYLIALGEMVRHRKHDIFIPIYLSDSIAMGRPKQEALEGPIFEVATSVGKFIVPAAIVHEKLIDPVFSVADESIRNRYKVSEFLERINHNFQDLDERSLPLIKELYEKLLALELKGINRIWARLLKNAFAPLFCGKFDLIVGNPPWINWEYLPEDYRNSTKSLWTEYGLIAESGRIGLGQLRRDLATLFVARCAHQYLQPTGKLGFLMPFNVFKTQGGDGFRMFLSRKTEVITVHDLSETYPFEGATNRTGLLVVRHGKTRFPIDCTVWYNDKSSGIDQELSLDTVRTVTKQFELYLAPIQKTQPDSPWAMTTEKAYDALTKFSKQSPYRGYEGIKTALNGIYWTELKASNLEKYATVENVGGVKIQVPRIQANVEKELLYPMIRGKDVLRWYSHPEYYIIAPHDPKSGKPLEERRMKVEFPKTYQFLLKFKQNLANRSIHKLWGKDNPFYSLYDIGSYTFQPYKVVWKDISGKISARGDFGGAAVIGKTKDNNLGKVQILPDATLMLIPCKYEDEAHYLAAVLNSIFTRFIATCYAVLHVGQHVLRYTDIRQYDSKNSEHQELAELSKQAHSLAIELHGKDNSLGEKLRSVEDKIDIVLAKVYGVTDIELEEIRKTMKILKEGEVVERETVEEHNAED